MAMIVAIMAVSTPTQAAVSGGTGGGIGSANFWKLVGTTLSPINPSWTVSVSSSSISGSGSANRVAYWSATSTLTSSGSLTFAPATGALTATSFVGSLTGNANTATALAANGANCTAGNYPLGVDASGAVESCTALGVGGNVNATGTVNYFPYFTATTTLSATSTLYASGTRIGIGTESPSSTFHVVGGGITQSGGLNSIASTTIVGHATATTATISSNLNASGTLVVTGIATFQNAINQAGAVNTFGSSTFSGNATATTATISSTLNASGTLNVTGLATFQNATTTINGRLGIGTASPSTSLHIVTGAITQTGAVNSIASTTIVGHASTTSLNVSGASNLSGGTATLGTIAGAIDAGGATSFEVPNGAGGTTVSAAGQATVDTTTRTWNFHDGTAEVRLNPEKCFAPSWTIENPTATEKDVVMFTNATSTVTRVWAVNKSAGDTVTFNIVASSSISAATSTSRKIFTSYQAVTATTTPACFMSATTTGCTTGTFGANASTTINFGDILFFSTTAASSSHFSFGMCWRENP